MATAPVKSQPLHNFSLPPHLRWAHKNSHHHHHQQQEQLENPPHSAVNRFRRRDSTDFDPPENDAAFPKPSSRAPRKPQPFSSCSASLTSFSPASHQNKKAEQNDDVVEEGERQWNLRPRKVVTFSSTITAAAATTTSSFRKGEREKEKVQEETGSYLRRNDSVLLKSSGSSRVRGGTTSLGEVLGTSGLYGTERQQRKVVEEKRKLWISLSKEEIEEDVYSLTGSRPSRRPKKRPRTLQKQLDNVFPGLYLVGMSIDSYRGHDSLR